MASGILGDAGGAVSSFAGAAGDLISSGGYEAEAASYRQASDTLQGAINIENQNVNIEKSSANIQEAQEQRQLYMVNSSARAQAGASGATTGSIAPVLQSSMQQGALAKQLIGSQASINENAFRATAIGYKSQQDAFQGQANAADAAAEAAKANAGGGILGGLLDVAAIAVML